MSSTPLVSGSEGSRLVAEDAKATQEPSALIDGVMLEPLAWTPPEPLLTRETTPSGVETKMSDARLVSSATRLVATDWRATILLSPAILANVLAPSAGAPPRPTLTSRVVAPARSRAKTSGLPLVSPATRLLASELNATVVQPPSMAG